MKVETLLKLVSVKRRHLFSVARKRVDGALATFDARGLHPLLQSETRLLSIRFGTSTKMLDS